MILADLKTIKSISSNSTAGIITISNENFSKISNSLYKFLTDFQYSEADRYLNAAEIEAKVFTVNEKLQMTLNGTEMFRVDGNGRLFAKKIISESVCQSMVNRLTYYEGFPKIGNPGEIVYGRNYDHQEIGFYGYVQNIGWVGFSGQSGTAPSEDSLMMPMSVAGRISEDLLPEYGDESYIITDGVHAGSVAIWDPLNNKYNFLTYPNGSYTVDSSTGDIYVCSEDGGEYNWSSVAKQATIGYDESGTGDYADGLYDDFDQDTRVGVAIDRFNKILKNTASGSQIAFKNIEGVAHTSDSTHYTDELYSGGITIPSKNVFAYDISDKVKAVEDGLVENKLSLLTKIDGTSAYYMRDGGKIVKTAVSGAFGKGYDIKVYDTTGRVIDKTKYIVQHASGVVFMLDKTVSPAKIEYSNYIGPTLADFVESSTVRLAYSDNIKHVSTVLGNSNHQLTELSITSTPKKNSNLVVKVNGVDVTVFGTSGNPASFACYFIDKSDANNIKTFDTLSIGDKLVWNTVSAGYTLDPNDTVSFEYLCTDSDTTSGGGGGGEGGNATTSINLMAGESIPSFSFVIIKEDGLVYVASADVTDLMADGFVVDGVTAGTECTVYLSGIVEVESINSNTGDYIYLSSNGEYDGVFDDSLCVLQNVGTSVDYNKIFIHIHEGTVLHEPTAYTISYLSGIPTGTVSFGSITPVTEYLKADTVTLPATAINTEDSSLIFEGWYSSSDCSGNKITSFGPGEHGNKTFYAKFTVPTYNITLNKNGGTINSGNVTEYVKGVGATLPTDITKTGNDFGGWKDNAELSGTSIASISSTETGDKEYWAKWTPITGQIRYDLGGGALPEDYPRSHTYGTETILPTNVTKTGSTFNGWYDNSSLEGDPITKIDAESCERVYWVYAKFSGETYTVNISESIKTTYSNLTWSAVN